MLDRHLSTIAPFGFNFDPARFLRAYRAAGCRFAQYYRNTACPPRLADVRLAAREADIAFDSIHGAFGPEIDPSSPDPSHRDDCLRLYRDEANLALELGVSMVVVHPAANFPDNRPRPRGELEPVQAARWPHFQDFAARLAEVGESTGVTFLIENVPCTCMLGFDAIELSRRVGKVGSPRLRMCLDSGHAHITGNLAETVIAAAPVIEYAHVHDNDGVNDGHLMPGDGTIDWVSFADALRRSGLGVPMMLEVFYSEQQVESLARNGLRERLARCCPTDGD